MLKNYFKHSLFLIPLLLSGCQNLLDGNKNIAGNLNESLKPLVIQIMDFLYPLFGFIGLIMLAISIYTLFIKPQSPSESAIVPLLMGVMEFSMGAMFIMSKKIVASFFGT